MEGDILQQNTPKKIEDIDAADLVVEILADLDQETAGTLRGITFKNNRVLSDFAKLRDLFPTENGEIFSRKKIATGLENLKRAYGEYGYINYTVVPSTTFNDEKTKAYLEIDADEGKQFYISRINVEGVGAPPRQQVLDELALRPGDIYNSRLWELSLQRVASVFSKCVCRSNQSLQLDERAGTVAVTVEFGSCS